MAECSDQLRTVKVIEIDRAIETASHKEAHLIADED